MINSECHQALLKPNLLVVCIYSTYIDWLTSKTQVSKIYIKDRKIKTIIKRPYENSVNSSLTKTHLRLSKFKRNTNCCIFRHISELHFCLTTFWGRKNSRVTASSLYIAHISQAYKNHPWSLHLQIQLYTILCWKCTRVLTDQTLLLPPSPAKLMVLVEVHTVLPVWVTAWDQFDRKFNESSDAISNP